MLDLSVAVICAMEKPGGGVGDPSDTAAGFELARFRLPSMTRILPGGTVKHHPPIGIFRAPSRQLDRHGMGAHLTMPLALESGATEP
nr:hypothetical protein GCM10020063_029370 [Dactylosporangium thailandense]